MAWTYSGDPASSQKDEYRFFIGDVDQDEPILTDAEILYVLDKHPSHNMRMYQLYQSAAMFFHRQIENKVGPIEEKPYQRARYFEKLAKQYYDKTQVIAVPVHKATKPVFTIGMNDND